MPIDLTLIHWVYVLFIALVILFMILRKDTTILCIIGIFFIAFTATGSVTASIISIFTSFVYAISELLPTILIISMIVAMSNSLMKTGINEVIIAPFTKFIRSPDTGFWIIGLLMLLISWFFWPTPAVALLGAVLVPVAIRAGLPAIGAAMAMNLFGHGIALSSDFVIQAAPKLTADAAGIAVQDVIHASLPLVAVMGISTTLVAFIQLKIDMKKGKLSSSSLVSTNRQENKIDTSLSFRTKQIFAILIPLFFAIDIIFLFFYHLQGGDATALIGGTAIIILFLIALISYKGKGLEKTTLFLMEGFQFGFKVFSPVIPIAAFFYLGDAGFSKIIGDYLPHTSNGIVNDLGASLASLVPLTKEMGAVTMTVIGAITGLDGSGFSGISLAGSIAKIFSHSLSGGTAVLTALGQVAAIWVGGGTLIPWALIPAAAICDVDPFELARRNLIPVCFGLLVTTIVAVFLL
ncbi:hypothetical protein ABE402_11700 [Bacillus smithii]|uniref:hypothetical protein n=1 Tax=Bacillus smithii TaxID=1479 RepID=UPI003D230322